MNFRRTFATSPPPVSSRNRPYAQALKRLSARTGTPFASLVVSFGILHEVTALVPLVGVFLGARAVGAGDRAVELVPSEWVTEGEEWAGRVGRRYGLFGYEKRGKSEESAPVALAGDVANAVLAYAVDRAFLMACPRIFQAGVGSREDKTLASDPSNNQFEGPSDERLEIDRAINQALNGLPFTSPSPVLNPS